MKNLVIFTATLLIVAAASVKADLLDCSPGLADIPGIGPKLTGSDDSSTEHEVKDFFKNVGCSIKKSAEKMTEHAKSWGADLKEGAKKLTEKAKEMGKDIKAKFTDYKDKMSKDSGEEMTKEELMSNVEIIDPEVLKAQQECGHGHILDALGICSKLRK